MLAAALQNIKPDIGVHHRVKPGSFRSFLARDKEFRPCVRQSGLLQALFAEMGDKSHQILQGHTKVYRSHNLESLCLLTRHEHDVMLLRPCIYLSLSSFVSFVFPVTLPLIIFIIIVVYIVYI